MPKIKITKECMSTVGQRKKEHEKVYFDIIMCFPLMRINGKEKLCICVVISNLSLLIPHFSLFLFNLS